MSRDQQETRSDWSASLSRDQLECSSGIVVIIFVVSAISLYALNCIKYEIIQITVAKEETSNYFKTRGEVSSGDQSRTDKCGL